MKKILLVTCGGTIGSKCVGDQIDVAAVEAPLVVAQYNNLYNHGKVCFEVTEPLNKLSENILPKDWLAIYRAIYAFDAAQFDGVIITCGTDTFAYTAAAMGFLLYHLKRPVVLVCANYPLNDSRSNGMDNFRNAVDFICAFPYGGVFTVYQHNGVGHINLATRINQFTHFTHLPLPAGDMYYGTIQDGAFIQNKREGNPDPISFPKEFWADGMPPRFCDDILYIKGYPSLNYRYFHFEQKRPKAILHSLYHSSTACIEGEGTSVIEFAKLCADYGVPIYVAPYYNREQRYVTDAKMMAGKIIPLYDITEVAALVKLMLAYGTFEGKQDNINEFLNSNIFFEKVLF